MMSKAAISLANWPRLPASAAFLAIFLFFSVGLVDSADLIPASLQYPVLEVKPAGFKAKRPPSLELAGAGNEYLIVHCRFPGADAASFSIKIIEKKPRPKAQKITFTFSQIVWAPPASRGKLPPDALLPLDQGLLATDSALEILVVLHIPAGHPKGSFPFELIASDKKNNYRQDLKVRVYNFALPEDLPITIFGGFWNYPPDHYVKYGVLSFEQYLQLIKSYYRIMRQYKINTLGGFYTFPFEELQPDKKIEEFTDYHHLLHYALDQLKYRFFMIPKLRGWRTINQPGDSFMSRANLFYPLYQEYLTRYGWQDRALNYLIDEPSPDFYAAVQQAYTVSKRLAPAIKTLCAGWNPDPEFVKVIDIWATPAAYYKEPQAKAARLLGQEQWLYANRLHAIDHPLVHQRLIGWVLYRHQFGGYLIWGVNFWPHDPWTAEPGSNTDYMRRGTFYYPHPLTGLPVPTLRLESLRRGLQDYLYFHLLQEARGKGLISQEMLAPIEQKLAALTDNFQGGSLQIPMQDLENLRLQMGELLDGGGKKMQNTPKLPSPGSDNHPEKSRFLLNLWRSLFNGG